MRRLTLALTCLLTACSPEPKDSGTDSASGTGSASTAGTTDATGTTAPTTGGAPTAAECQQDSDCMLVNNCCECSATPVGAPVDPCEGNCFQPTCDALSLFNVTVACRSGRCEWKNVDCVDGPVACDQQKPTCPEGTSVSVVDGCWGPCLEPRYCNNTDCTPGSCGDGWTCVASQAGGSTCVPIAHECAGTPTCACMDPYLSEFCPAGCSDAVDGLLCEDGG